jgi:hypothetical protein
MKGFAASLICHSLLSVFALPLAAHGESSNAGGLQPAGLAVSAGREFCLIGDVHRKSLILVDLRAGEVKVRRLSFTDAVADLVHLHGDSFAAIVPANRELVRFECDGSEIRDVDRVPLGIDPQRVAASPLRDWLCVTDRWSRQVQPIRVSRSESPRASTPIAVPFEPQEILGLGENRFLVADAFGGGLAVVDVSTPEVVAVHQLQAHAIRGLVLSPDGKTILLTHQRLNRVARTDLDDIHWGNTIENLVSRISVRSLLDNQKKVQSRELIRLGDVGNGFADPTGIVDLGSLQVVASGGANQLAIVRGGVVGERLKTGKRPTHMVQVNDRRILTLNAHDASITDVILEGVSADENPAFPRVEGRTFKLDQRAAATPGEIAFYSGDLSHDAWLTCNSCHVDGHTAGVLADTFGDGGFGNPKLIPSLMGVAGTEPLGWLGNKTNLEQQIEATLQSTMHGAEGKGREVATDLAEYLQSLDLPVRPDQVDADDVAAGESLFHELRCASCHSPPSYTSPQIQEVGVTDELGNKQFNPPSLRGLRLRRRLFHDGRFDSLNSLLEDGKHQLPRDLTDEERSRLIDFLRAL